MWEAPQVPNNSIPEMTPTVELAPKPRYDHKTERSIWAMEVRPVEAIVISNSLRRISRTRLTPGAPPAANP